MSVERPSLVPHGDTSHTALLLAAEETRMRREGYTDQDITMWLRQHGGPHPRA